jgi:hypothetical protein
MHSLGAGPAVTPTAAVDWSIRYQQPHNCMVLKASLANERCEFKLRIFVGIRTAKNPMATVPFRARGRVTPARDYSFSIRRDLTFFSSVFCFRVVSVSDEYSLSNGLGW